MAARGRAGDATRQARDEFRTLRAHLEEGILSLATSVDGRRFTYQASLHGFELQPGGYVNLSPPGRDPQRMNSTADVGALAGAFSFVPPGLLDRATAFRQGETLIAGKLSGHPALVRVGRRISEEGGGDVASGWADAPRG